MATAERPGRDVNPARAKSEQVYESSPVNRVVHAEDPFTRVLEQQAARVPSDVFLIASILAMGGSLYCYLRGMTDRSLLLGLWAPTLLTMGVYNKLVKTLKPR